MSRPVTAASLAELNERKPLWPVASLLVLTGLNLLDYLDRNVLAQVLSPLAKELGLSDRQSGTVDAAFMLGYFLTSPIFGYLGDRFARRWLIAAGVLVWSIGTVMSGHVHAYVSLVLFRVLVGFGEASFGTISPSWIADLFPAGKRNNAITIFYLTIPVGSALGYLLGGHMAVHYGWRSAFWLAGYPGLFLAFSLFFLREPSRGANDPVATTPAAEGGPSGWRAYAELGKFPAYLLVVAGYAAQTFALGGFRFWAPSFLERVHHLKLDEAGYFFSAALASTGLVATLIGGFLATAWQRRTGTGYAWMLALSAIAGAPFSFLAFSLDDLFAAKAMLVLTMFLIFFSTGPVNTLILETVPPRMRASSMAASIFAIHMFGDLWSPTLVGYISDRGHDLQHAVLCVLPIALIVSAVFWTALLVWTRRHPT